MENKKNDWFATLLFQPEMTIDDFASNNITPDNTELKSKDYYKGKQQVIDYFTNKNTGKFDEDVFDNAYNSAMSTFNDYANDDFEKRVIENYEYDPFDLLAPPDSKRRDVTPQVVRQPNPFRQSKGLTNLRGWGNPTMSAREVAQQNKVFNPETQTFEN